MRKRVLFGCVLAVTLTMFITGCNKKAPDIKPIEYSEQIGTAEGTVDFESEEEPEIDIKEIQSYKGENIDYSSGIEIKNVEKFEDFQMWVDSTGVDIYVPGKYIAVYRFVYNDNTIEKKVSVTILEKEEEQQVSTYSSANNMAGNTGSQNSSSSDATEATTPQGNEEHGSSQESMGEGDSQKPVVNNGDENGNSQNTGTQQPDVPTAGDSPTQQPPQKPTQQQTQKPTQQQTQKPTQQTATQKPTGQQPTTKQPETSKEIVTTRKTSTDKISTIGYTNIELLSGTYVKIKCTNAKYIVSTRTDTSTTTKNGVKYEVKKLVITFNTGAEQVLETSETAIK